MNKSHGVADGDHPSYSFRVKIEPSPQLLCLDDATLQGWWHNDPVLLQLNMKSQLKAWLKCSLEQCSS